MTFYGLERPVDYGRQLIFDPTTANMVLLAQLAYAAALQKEYYRNIEELKEFLEKYGDFITPIIKDQAWVQENINDPIRNAVNAMYDQGVNPLTNRQAMAELERIRRNLPYATFAQVKEGAKIAEQYLKNMADLQKNGLYDPVLEGYAGKSLSEWSTVNDGIWNRLSPVPIQNAAQFSKDYFDNITPIQRQETRNGVNYTVSEVTEGMLHDIADRHFNDLVNTPQGQLMYKRYKAELGSDEAARAAFNDAIVAGNLDRLKSANNYLEMAAKERDYRLRKSSNDLAWQKFYWDRDKEQQELDIKRAVARGDSGQEGTQEQGFSLAQRWYDAGLAKALSADGITKNWWEMGNLYSDNGKRIYDTAMKFGEKFTTKLPSTEDLMTYYNDDSVVKQYDSKIVRNALNTPENNRTALQNLIVKRLEDQYYKHVEKKPRMSDDDIRKAFRNQYTIGMDTKSVAGAIGDTVSGNDRVVQATAANIDKLYGMDDIETNTAGYRRKHVNSDTDKIRRDIVRYKPENVTITPMGNGYASLRKNGRFEVMPRVRVTITTPDGPIEYDAYYDIGLSSYHTSGGAYMLSGTKKVYPGGSHVQLYSTPTQMANLDIDLTPDVSVYDGDYNLYPDYNRWTEFGPWDIRESSNLKASPTQKLGGY